MMRKKKQRLWPYNLPFHDDLIPIRGLTNADPNISDSSGRGIHLLSRGISSQRLLKDSLKRGLDSMLAEVVKTRGHLMFPEPPSDSSATITRGKRKRNRGLSSR